MVDLRHWGCRWAQTQFLVRDAHKAARDAAKQKVLVPGSDNSTGSEHVEAGSDIDEID
jgi:hypothetical protein